MKHNETVNVQLTFKQKVPPKNQMAAADFDNYYTIEVKRHDGEGLSNDEAREIIYTYLLMTSKQARSRK
jgi:hypothetical protein